MSSPTLQKELNGQMANRIDLIPLHALADWVKEARQRTFELVEDLTGDQLMGPRLAIVNPLLWEIGHQAWFQEKWVLRHTAQQRPIRPDADALYDSATVPHDTRWDLPLPNRDETLRYMTTVRDRVHERILQREPSPEEIYFVLLSVFHEDMHTEAITYTRQTLGYRRPRFRGQESGVRSQGSGVRSQGSGVRGQGSGVRSQKWMNRVFILASDF